MAKPILVVHIPRGASRSTLEEVRINLDKKFSDWHVLVVGGGDSEEPKFSCYSDTMAMDIQIEKLKEELKQLVNAD